VRKARILERSDLLAELVTKKSKEIQGVLIGTTFDALVPARFFRAARSNKRPSCGKRRVERLVHPQTLSNPF